MTNFTIFNQLTAMPKRLAMVLTVLFTLGVGSMWGAEVFNITSYSSSPSGWTNSNVGTGSYFNFNTSGCYLITSTYGPHTSLTLTYKVATYGSGTNHPLTIQLLDENGTVKQTHTTGTPTSSSYISGTWSIGDVNYNFKIKFYLQTTGKGVRLQVPKLVGTAAASCDKKVTIQKGTESNGSFNISKNGTYETCDEDLVITLSNITANAGYQVGQITQTGINSGVTIDQENKTVTYAQNTSGTSTINVTFTELPKYTVTWKVNGTEYNAGSPTTQVYDGGKVTTLPTAPKPAEYCGQVFAGWTKSPIDGEIDTEPSVLFTTAANSPAITEPTTFYAVFADYAD